MPFAFLWHLDGTPGVHKLYIFALRPTNSLGAVDPVAVELPEHSPIGLQVQGMSRVEIARNQLV